MLPKFVFALLGARENVLGTPTTTLHRWQKRGSRTESIGASTTRQELWRNGFSVFLTCDRRKIDICRKQMLLMWEKWRTTFTISWFCSFFFHQSDSELSRQNGCLFVSLTRKENLLIFGPERFDNPLVPFPLPTWYHDCTNWLLWEQLWKGINFKNILWHRRLCQLWIMGSILAWLTTRIIGS